MLTHKDTQRLICWFEMLDPASVSEKDKTLVTSLYSSLGLDIPEHVAAKYNISRSLSDCTADPTMIVDGHLIQPDYR